MAGWRTMALPVPPPDERDRHVAPMGDVAELMSGVDVPEDDESSGPLQENDDGSADLLEEDKPKPSRQIPFDANLAEHIDELEMDGVSLDLLRKIDRDKEARKKRDEQYEEGIRRAGVSNDAPGGASFQGASRVVHPMIAEGCVDFAASAMRELFPPNGPVRTKIEGEVTSEKLTTADRQERYLNWQLTEKITEYPDELEQTLTQVPLGGSQYMKFWHDDAERRITCEFVPIDDMIIPYACSDFYSAQRITHVQRITQMIFEERVESGFYRDIEALAPESGQVPEPTRSGQATDKVEGRESTPENVDGERIIYEVSTYAEFEIDGEERAPYLISIDEETGKVVAIYRNWEEEDRAMKRLEWIVEYGFISWRGAYKIGLPHLIGGLSAAATGSLRALLDSAHMNTMPGFLRLKGARMGGQSKNIDPASGVEIEASAAVDDIRKLTMALPYNPPSPVLYELLGWLTEAARGVVTTAEEKIAEANSQMPVGTTLALIEQGAKVFSSIHARLHRSQRRALRIIARLNKKHLSIADQIQELGEVIATREDFAQPLAVIPVSDPNIFSETQRYAQMQMVMQVAAQYPQVHDMYAVLKRTYEIAKVPEIDEILPEKKDPTELNSAAENAAVMMGSPIMAFPEQEHLAHLEVHLRFITDPMFGGAQFAAQKSMPLMMEHVKQHLSFLYAKTIYDLAQKSLHGADLSKMLKDRAQAGMMDKLFAAASRVTHQALSQLLQPLGPVIQGMLQQIAAMTPPQPMTPEQAAMAIAKQETERKGQKDKSDSQLEGRALDIKQEGEQVGAQIKEKQIELQHEDNMAKLGASADQAAAGTKVDLAKHFTGMEHEKQQSQAAADQQAQLKTQELANQNAQAQQLQQVDMAKHQAGLQAQGVQAREGGAIDLAKHITSLDHQAEQAQAGHEVDLTKHATGLEHQSQETEQGHAVDLTKHFSAQQSSEAQHAADLAAQKQHQGAELKAREKSEKLKAQQAAKQAAQQPKKGKP